MPCALDLVQCHEALGNAWHQCIIKFSLHLLSHIYALCNGTVWISNASFSNDTLQVRFVAGNPLNAYISSKVPAEQTCLNQQPCLISQVNWCGWGKTNFLDKTSPNQHNWLFPKWVCINIKGILTLQSRPLKSGLSPRKSSSGWQGSKITGLCSYRVGWSLLRFDLSNLETTDLADRRMWLRLAAKLSSAF